MDSESAQNGDFDELFESLYTEMYAIKDELEDAEKDKREAEYSGEPDRRNDYCYVRTEKPSGRI